MPENTPTQVPVSVLMDISRGVGRIEGDIRSVKDGMIAHLEEHKNAKDRAQWALGTSIMAILGVLGILVTILSGHASVGS